MNCFVYQMGVIYVDERESGLFGSVNGTCFKKLTSGVLKVILKLVVLACTARCPPIFEFLKFVIKPLY